ncbi:MAG: 6-carboxytetrahydropterin synthase [Phycisphaeraceae bacterium]|nr:6-carboxytetrahydropterin synthase [Phycisphaeraceae bacterium]MCW5761785.1 6-carboxytetrahydropterin synthase [Phycisphaeraceae bacterium]
MYEITVEHVFSAAHSVRIAGQSEPLHGHDWRVTATITAPRLDADGFVCDFHAAEEALAKVCLPFKNRTLNDVPPFADVNPSAEQVARVLAESLAVLLHPILPPDARLASLRVTEAPGCAATFVAESAR